MTHTYLRQLTTRRSSFPKGPKREHFLALATPDAVAEAKTRDPTLFMASNYGIEQSLILSYWSSAAWAWSVYEEDEPPLILFNDI